jgi:hypothetical protein
MACDLWRLSGRAVFSNAGWAISCCGITLPDCTFKSFLSMLHLSNTYPISQTWFSPRSFSLLPFWKYSCSYRAHSWPLISFSLVYSVKPQCPNTYTVQVTPSLLNLTPADSAVCQMSALSQGSMTHPSSSRGSGANRAMTDVPL